jgi:hypothetical protein
VPGIQLEEAVPEGAMRHLAFAVVASLIVACGGSPLSPEVPAGMSIGSLDMGPGQTSTGQKINVYFLEDDVLAKGNVHLVGLPVTVSAFPTTTFYTDRQGSITFVLPQDDKVVEISTEAYEGYCQSTTTLFLPLYQRTAFIRLSSGC